MNQRTPCASTGEFFNNIRQKRPLNEALLERHTLPKGSRGPSIFGGFALGTGCQEILHSHKIGITGHDHRQTVLMSNRPPNSRRPLEGSNGPSAMEHSHDML